MKASHIIPPAMALIAALAWNGSLWRSIATLDKQGRILRERIESARSSPASTAGTGSTRVKKRGGNEPIHWHDLVARMADSRKKGGTVDPPEIMAFRKRLAEMTADEIIAAFDEISALGLESEARKMLEKWLVGPLIGKDPELALETLADRIQSDPEGVGRQLAAALRAWAKKDPAAAGAWFDRQIAAGLFDSKSLDGKSSVRMEFEAALVGDLLATDPAAAGQRIAALPDDQRREALQRIPFPELSPAAQTAYAQLVRGLVPQDERAGSFTHVVAELVPGGGYAKVGAFLDGIQATPDERAVSAREAANVGLEKIAGERAVTREDVDAMRAWLMLQSPATVDRITGGALGDAAQNGGQFGFAEASKLALEFQTSTGNDAVLVAFIESFAAHSNPGMALPLVDRIADPKIRADVLTRLKSNAGP